MIGRPPRKLSQSAYLLIRQIREENERINRTDPALRNSVAAEPAVAPARRRYAFAPLPIGIPLLSPDAIDKVMSEEEWKAA